MTRFFFPDAEVLAKSNHHGVARVPVLFDMEYRIRVAESRYLRERAAMMWPVVRRRKFRSGGPARNTLIGNARRLQHFADWCDLMKITVENAKYSDVIRYQNAQAGGDAPYFKRPVSRATANLRADTATDFLRWAAHRDVRKKPFVVEMDASIRLINDGRSIGTTTVPTERRSERLSEIRNDKFFRFPVLPERNDIARWLQSVRNGRGYAKFLICCFMADTGVRLDEAVSIETRQWPSHLTIADFANRRFVPLTLEKTKGNVPRTIDVPMRLTRVVRKWIDEEHPRLSTIHMDRLEANAPSPRLFISDCKHSEGIPIQRHTVYDCFTEVTPRPRSWHPHMARHAYACHYMRDYVERERKAQRSSAGGEWVRNTGQFALDTIRRQFGHVDGDTTEIYLRLLETTVGLGQTATEYQDLLDGLE